MSNSLSKESVPGKVAAFSNRVGPNRLVFLAGALLLVASMVFMYRVGLMAIRAEAKATKKLLVLQHLADFTAALHETEISRWEYLLTGDPENLRPYYYASELIRTNLSDLRKLVTTGELPPQDVDRLMQLTEEKLSQSEQTMRARKKALIPDPTVGPSTPEEKRIMREIKEEISRINALEETEYSGATQQARFAMRIRGATFFSVCLANLLFLSWAYRKISREASLREMASAETNRQKEFLQTTLASIADGVIATDSKGAILFMNPVAESLTGVKQPDVSGTQVEPILNVVDDVTRQKAQSPIVKVLADRVTTKAKSPVILIGKDGVEHTIIESAAPIVTANGMMIGAVLVLRDVAERREAELATRRLAAIVENSEDAIISKSLDGIIQSWNRGAETIFGYTAAEAIGKPITTLIPDEYLHEEAEIMRRLRSGKRIEHFESIRTTRDKRRINVSLAISPIKDSSGRIIGASKVLRDITKRKQTENAAREASERYRALFNSMDEGFCVVEVIFDERKHPVDYRFLEVNPAFEKQTGIKNATGQQMRSLAPTHEEYWFETYGKVASTGEPIRFEQFASSLKRWFDVYAYRVGPSEANRVAILFTDITQRKLSEQALARVKQELEATVEERTRDLKQTIAELETFSYTVSHDLRSPLRAMQGFAQALIEEYGDKLDAEGREYLKRISSAAVRLDQLIQDVLTFTRIGRTSINIQPVSLDDVVDEVLRTFAEVQKPHAKVTVQNPLDRVLASRPLLVQSISNLLGNAVKFVPAKASALIRVWTERHGSKVKLFVEDNGIGIPENLMSKIFEPFQRGHPGAGYEGTGMGLALVRKAMHRMNGDVGVESKVGHGSKFWLELPAAEP